MYYAFPDRISQYNPACPSIFLEKPLVFFLFKKLKLQMMGHYFIKILWDTKDEQSWANVSLVHLVALASHHT